MEKENAGTSNYQILILLNHDQSNSKMKKFLIKLLIGLLKNVTGINPRLPDFVISLFTGKSDPKDIEIVLTDSDKDGNPEIQISNKGDVIFRHEIKVMLKD